MDESNGGTPDSSILPGSTDNSGAAPQAPPHSALPQASPHGASPHGASPHGALPQASPPQGTPASTLPAGTDSSGAAPQAPPHSALPQASPPQGTPFSILPSSTDSSGAIAPKLAVLRALAEDEHVTRAAERVGVPQPTVSRWLAELTQDLGTPVVVREGRRVRLTRAGRLLAEAAERAMTALEAGLRQVEEEVDPDKGRVVLGFLHMLGRERIPALVRGFREHHPHVRFGLVQNSRQVILEQLASTEIDLALVAPPPEDPAFESAVLFEQQLIVIVPDTHRLATRQEVRLIDLEDDDFILLEHGYGLRQITDEMFADAGFTPKIAFESQEIETVRGLVAAGLGVAVLTHADPAPEGLVELPLVPRASRRFGLVWLKDHPLPPAVRRFRDHALEA
ncbi:LysR substrate-binding domain-containing protein [Lentzea sp. NBRC 105346]|uniref:LysR family transcriptional regulator n=1 Tax=Lentzea sp. NBRC 105346 TaxID=3032205 RepID=UPI00333029CB